MKAPFSLWVKGSRAVAFGKSKAHAHCRLRVVRAPQRKEEVNGPFPQGNCCATRTNKGTWREMRRREQGLVDSTRQKLRARG